MAGLSSAGEAAVIAALDTVAYVSLHTADPGNTGANEVAGGGYARQGPVAFTNSGANPTVAGNNSIITYPTATAAWGTINFFGLWTAASAGVFNGGAAVATPKVVNNGDQARFAANALTITAD
jgi:hypothetical protein